VHHDFGLRKLVYWPLHIFDFTPRPVSETDILYYMW
jgi:hypothetical protein